MMSVAMPVAQPMHGAQNCRPNPSVPVRLKDVAVTASERNWGVALHLSRFADLLMPIPIVISVILWLTQKNRSSFLDDQGRDVINFGISFLLYHFVLGITLIGIVLFPVLWIVALVNIIRGAVAASNGEYFRYPMTIRFLS